MREINLEEVSLTWTHGVERGRKLQEHSSWWEIKLVFPTVISPQSKEKDGEKLDCCVGLSCFRNAKRSGRGGEDEPV